MSEETKTIVIIDHPVGQRDDRASQLLAARGYDVQWVRVAAGERPPAPGPAFAGAIVYGGPESVNDLVQFPYLAEEMAWIETWVAAEQPFLGVCLGAQMLARVLGAPVTRHPEGLHEIGYVEIEPTTTCGFLSEPLSVYHWHNEGFEVPACAERLAAGPVFPNQAFRYGKNAYAIQFHPEVSEQVMRRWLSEATESLAAPGAQPAEMQLAAAKRYDRGMADWLSSFMDRWLGPGPKDTTAP